MVVVAFWLVGWASRDELGFSGRKSLTVIIKAEILRYIFVVSNP
jgi:hypothetical protein